MVIIKKIDRTRAKVVDRIIRISKGINQDSIFIVVELLPNITGVACDVKEEEEENILNFHLREEKRKKEETSYTQRVDSVN